MTTLPERHDVFGTDISLTSVAEVVDRILQTTPGGLTVVIANVHSVMTSRRKPELARALRDADIATADGVPLVWALRASGLESAQRVTGIDVMRGALSLGRPTGTRHYLYGSTEPVLGDVIRNIESEYPGALVTGAMSPPFNELSDAELDTHAEAITSSGANIVWVGLGMPKQELWMARARSRLPGVNLVGVGAAFDWLAGSTPMAPQWMRDRGLEWAYRLAREPRRMWKRYAYNNPAFLVLLARRWLEKLGSVSTKR